MMAKSLENEDNPTLSKAFEDQLKIYAEIENSELSTASKELQDKISSAIKKLEEITMHISYVGVFSSNETIDELSTNSLKFLMLPVLLGSLTLKLVQKDREDVLRIASVYFKDFLTRCNQYQLTSYSNPTEDNNKNASDAAPVPKSKGNARPTPEDLKLLAQQREDKIARYVKRKALNSKLVELKIAIENPSHDEDLVREYYMTMINHFICKSLDELDSVSMERNMLQQMKQMKLGNVVIPSKEEKVEPLRPFLITRNSEQKKVFGAGYPSLPTFSVDEFYDQRVKDGWFPPGHVSHSQVEAKSPEDTQEEEVDGHSEEDENERETLRRRDEWKDTHSAGWGNTYNRS